MSEFDEFDGPAAVQEDGAAADPYAIEALLLPSGAKVTFRSMATLTGSNVRWLRGVDDRDGAMLMYNEINIRAMILLVDTWDLTAPGGRPLPVPRDLRDPKDRSWTKQIGAFDFTAIERHIQKPVMRLIGDDIGTPEGE